MGDLLSRFGTWLVGQLRDLFQWIIETVAGIGEGLVESVLLPLFSGLPGVDFTSLLGVWDQVNWFIPAAEMMGYLTLYLVALGLVVMYRLLKSWIPTVSGS